MVRLLLSIILLLSCLSSFGQGFRVKSFSLKTSDLSASTHPREDANGQSCGLIKVQTKVPGLVFDGNIVGVVENQTNEYWVYLPKGTQDLTVMRPDYLPNTIRFADYGVDAISAKNTYVLTLKEDNLHQEKCAVTIQVKPRDAQVNVDDIPLKKNNDGGYKLLLPKGEHICSFSAVGYKSSVQMVTTGKGIQNINMELVSILADLNIVCQTGTAEIIIDNEIKGIGGWKGKVMPGQHQIEVRQEGYEPISKSVTLVEKDNQTIALPALQAIKGSLNITTTPSGCDVYLDGQHFGKSPCEITDVLYGSHSLMITIDSCGINKDKSFDIKIQNTSCQDLSYEIVEAQKFIAYNNAYKWFKDGYYAEFRKEPEEGEDTRRDYYDKIMDVFDKLEKDFFVQKVSLSLGYFFGVEVHDEKQIAEMLIEHYVKKDEYSKKLPEPEKAILIAEKIDSLEKYSNSIAYGFFLKKDYQNALVWSQRSEIKSDIIMGKCYLMLNNNVEAKKCFSKVEAISITDNYLIVGIIESIGDQYLEKGDKNEAIIWYKKAIQREDNPYIRDRIQDKIRELQ